jgi:hypothetical protein
MTNVLNLLMQLSEPAGLVEVGDGNNFPMLFN